MEGTAMGDEELVPQDTQHNHAGGAPENIYAGDVPQGEDPGTPGGQDAASPDNKYAGGAGK